MSDNVWPIQSLAQADVKIIDGDRGINYPKKTDFFKEGYCLFLSAKNVTKNGFNFDECQFIMKTKYEKMSKGQLLLGDLVLTTRGTVGNVAHYDKKVPFDKIRINSGMVLLRTENLKINEKFLYLVFQSYLISHQIDALVFGSAQLQLTVKIIKSLKVPTPPLLEQKKIAEILSTWDRTIELTKKLIELKEKKKRGLMQQLLTGKKRFPGFIGKWEKKNFSKLYKTISGKHLQIKRNEYLQTGKYPIVDQGKKLISRYSNQEKSFMDVPLIVFGDHTREVKYIDFPFIPGADGTILLKTTTKMNILFGYYLLKMKHIPNLGYSRHMRELKECFFNYPLEISEQAIIADMLWSSDKEIKTISLQRKFIQRQKKGLMKKLLTGKWRVAV